MIAKPFVLGLAGVSVLALGFAALVQAPLRLVYNGSRSVPVGWYVVDEASPFERGDLVLAIPADAFSRLIARREYLPADVPLIKRVAALSGDRVCYRQGALTVTQGGANKPSITVRPALLDRRGRVMPHWTECRELVDGEVFLLLDDTDASLDSRYFGPVPRASIRGKLRPLGRR